MCQAQSSADSTTEAIHRSFHPDDAPEENDTVAENAEWLNARMSECYND
jgi:hypothetical protein